MLSTEERACRLPFLEAWLALEGCHVVSCDRLQGCCHRGLCLLSVRGTGVERRLKCPGSEDMVKQWGC